MKETYFCKHYRAMSNHKTCKKDVAYEDFKGVKFDDQPCFERNGIAPPGCQLAEFPNAEEKAAEQEEMNKRILALGTARQAIVKHLGGPWKRGTVGGSGVIDCPVCGKEKSLQFSRSGYNGHIHAGCKTQGCVRWME